jgi:hypothetical protein
VTHGGQAVRKLVTDLAKLIRDGEEIRVASKDSGKDLTAATMAQIIFEETRLGLFGQPCFDVTAQWREQIDLECVVGREELGVDNLAVVDPKYRALFDVEIENGDHVGFSFPGMRLLEPKLESFRGHLD